jgi:hypothetical protein
VRPGIRLLVFVVYLALDFSLPAMPGASIFESTEDVESIGRSRARETSDVQPITPLRSDSPLFARTPDDVPDGSTSSTMEIRRPRLRVTSRLPRATLAPAPRSADPH